MRRLCLAFASSALLVGVGVSAGCNGGGSGDGDGDTDDFGDADAGESGIDSTATAESTATATATNGDDDWGDEGDDDGWGDDASEDDGGNGVCAYEGVYASAWLDHLSPGVSTQTFYCRVGEVELNASGDTSELRAFMSCREGDGPEVETGFAVEASPAFDQFIDEGDRLRITRGFANGGPEQGLRLAVERDGEGRILSFVEGVTLSSSVGPDPALPFFRGVESMGCTATDGACGEGPAQRLVFETPAGFTRVGHQEAKLRQPPGDLNVWVREAYSSNSAICEFPIEYSVLMIRG